jgi:hypothetical protein
MSVAMRGRAGSTGAGRGVTPAKTFLAAWKCLDHSVRTQANSIVSATSTPLIAMTSRRV